MGGGVRLLSRLFHHRWSVPILARLAAWRIGTRFVVLLHELEISRDTLSATLRELIALGLIARNPGYGHPLRPEYILTPAGHAVAPACLAFVETIKAAELEEVAYRKWSMPLLVAVQEGHARFTDLKGVLEGITPRALTQSLKQLGQAQLLLRRIEATYPPSVTYELSLLGIGIARAAAAIARAAPSGFA